ncbi:MAG: tRNA 4-thiouridine(8) synthase ThiI [Chloroflexi bacterium]|nr:tRNA 4-thiouridine(8) synthase ThiI [Chloroflexota bacterium]
MEQFVAVRFFHEIALKGQNRPLFTRRVVKNLKSALAGTGARIIVLNPMLAVIPLNGGALWPVLEERLRHVVGVEKFAPVYRLPPSLDAVKKALASLLERRSAQSFRITTRRNDKGFPLTSPEVNAELGAFVQNLKGFPVDLKHPELNIFLDILPGQAHLSFEEIPGPGGLPVGVSGRVACLLSGGIDSPVAAWRMMNRGCEVLFVHFHSFPLVEGTSREKAQDLVQLLTQYQYRSTLYLVPFGEVQQRLIVSVPPAYRVVLYRRFMLRIAEALGMRHGARAMVTGESLGQVSSQTLENLTTINSAAGRLPVLRPLIGMDKAEIIAQAKRLGTYPISILPDQDCCTLFVPKHPVTRSRPEEVQALESRLEVEAMEEAAVAAAQRHDFAWPQESGSGSGELPTSTASPAWVPGTVKG